MQLLTNGDARYFRNWATLVPLLLAATVVEGIAALFWAVAHTDGLPDGLAVWRPETLSMPDLYLPAMEVASASASLPSRQAPQERWPMRM